MPLFLLLLSDLQEFVLKNVQKQRMNLKEMLDIHLGLSDELSQEMVSVADPKLVTILDDEIRLQL